MNEHQQFVKLIQRHRPVKALRDAEGPETRIGAAGFCWDGQHAVRLAAGSKTAADGCRLVNTVFTTHPSHVAVPADFESATVPLSACVEDRDMIMSPA